jgi:hypothetical protein
MGIDCQYSVVIGVRVAEDDVPKLIREYTDFDLEGCDSDDDVWEYAREDLFGDGIVIKETSYYIKQFVTYENSSYFICLKESSAFKNWRSKTSMTFPSMTCDKSELYKMQEFLSTIGIKTPVKAYLINSAC